MVRLTYLLSLTLPFRKSLSRLEGLTQDEQEDTYAWPIEKTTM